MVRSRCESHHSNEITEHDSLQLTSATKSAQSGHLDCAEGCPLLGVKWTSKFKSVMSAFDAVDGAHSAASKCNTGLKRGAIQGGEGTADSGIDDMELKVLTNWRGHDDVMQIRSIRGSGEPVWVNASLNACFRLGPDPRRALWPAATSVAQTGRTHDRTRPMLQKRQKVLARAPSFAQPSAPYHCISFCYS